MSAAGAGTAPSAPSLESPRLEGRVALVTGGARGLGRACALRLGRLGASVAVADVNLAGAVDAGEAPEPVVSELEAAGVAAAGYELDVADRSAVSAAVESAVQRFDGLDVLVCSAGWLGPFEGSSASEASPAMFESTLGINLYGTINCCQAAAPALCSGGWGKVVNFSSLAALRPLEDGLGAAYVSSKAAVIGYTLSLADELGPDGVTVNAVAPGSIDTPMTRALFSDMDDPAAHARLPQRRFGQPDDVARVVDFLATPLSDYVTGQVICVDGGLSITDGLRGSGLDGSAP